MCEKTNKTFKYCCSFFFQLYTLSHFSFSGKLFHRRVLLRRDWHTSENPDDITNYKTSSFFSFSPVLFRTTKFLPVFRSTIFTSPPLANNPRSCRSIGFLQLSLSPAAPSTGIQSLSGLSISLDTWGPHAWATKREKQAVYLQLSMVLFFCLKRGGARTSWH